MARHGHRRTGFHVADPTLRGPDRPGPIRAVRRVLAGHGLLVAAGLYCLAWFVFWASYWIVALSGHVRSP